MNSNGKFRVRIKLFNSITQQGVRYKFGDLS